MPKIGQKNDSISLMKYLNKAKIESIISISQAILDASYYSEKNAEELLDNGIQFLTRLVVISHQALFNKPFHFAGMRLFILIIEESSGKV